MFPKYPLFLLIVLTLGCAKSDRRVVVACAQDRDFATGLFKEFETQHGLTIAPKFDTEANKSVGLAAELVAEKDRPRCDVHWNNEILATIRLARQGIYERYESPQSAGFPSWSKASDGTWQAFAARARVLIVNTKLVPEAERPKSLIDLTLPKWKRKVAIAKPLYGTTATHAACLFEALGPESAKAFFRSMIANDVGVVAGNKQVAVDVASGRFAVGLTDTDDALIELDAGKPVAVIFPDRDGHPTYPKLGVLFIPNTVAVVKKCPNLTGAQKMIDFLLRPESEAALATAGGFQIPLNPKVDAKLHSALVTPSQVKAMEVDFEKAADLWEKTQVYLRNEFVR